jgi:hypothetical protein
MKTILRKRGTDVKQRIHGVAPMMSHPWQEAGRVARNMLLSVAGQQAPRKRSTRALRPVSDRYPDRGDAFPGAVAGQEKTPHCCGVFYGMVGVARIELATPTMST